MSKGKDAGAVKAILAYLNRQNRPYSAIDIFNNLHKEFGKTAVVKGCESLAQDGKIREKTYGKQKVYVADQSQFADVDESEIQSMDKRVAEMTEELRTNMADIHKAETELKSLTSSLTTAEAERLLGEVTQSCHSLKSKLASLKEGQVLISKEDKDKIYHERAKFVKEWRKRKRMSNDILGAILEGYPKTKKQLYEDIGVETDEDYKVTPPEL
ncbi:homologous-pairing protein 2 homolog [Liolophura sinensis]|uniref:homologous-pairing protein 2 homolog n=1 Tax=Liolophura sinensis TaxID=3198878 RepID=UPI003159514C